MMREIHGLTEEPRIQRRWFHDDYFDLFVWQADGGAIVQFQLCYGIDSSERALVWHERGGFFLDGVGNGESGREETLPAKKASGDPFNVAPVVTRFEAAARTLPEDLRTAVTARIHEFAAKKAATPARRKSFRRASWQRP